ncbi:hypothetical protein CTEST_11015 [Corynebacterium testudinoris]|uniref:Fluoride-specific ion channel FluC n=1 Tax=Corynebacterium testudinoris TaxID=136857 RepID=A0A0G3H8F5_9CORY|nr:hypothetical protein CTEST_11015 [Corynebacterium testudinoris]
MIPEPLAVGIGAALGALLRFAAQGILGAGMWPLLAVNLLGSFLMGRLRPGPFWGTGVLGGFTSFSTFASLTLAPSLTVGAAYAALTLIGCVGAWLLGDLL